MRELQVYLKTTETCQLNCEHCFTSGSKGKRVFFKPEKVVGFFERLKKVAPGITNSRVDFHGGEPMLAPIPDMLTAYEGIKNAFPQTVFGVQTNLVYKLTDEKLDFLDTVTKRQTIGTSWDKNIRFPSEKAEQLWAENVKKLVSLGYNVTVMICLTKHTVQMEPREIIEKMIDLGVSYVNFERLTHNGNARDDSSLAAGNKVLDAYFVKMYEQTIQYGYHKQIKNMFFDSVTGALLQNVHGGERCRNCEQKIFTLNADGTVGGCPNSAVEKPYARIDWPIMEILYSKGRMKEISCEAARHPLCYSCDVFDICNGDCHQLSWEGETCPAPKTLMRQLKRENNTTVMNEIANGFPG